MKNVFLMLLMLFTVPVHAKVVEIKSMSQILPAVSADTLVIFDLDNTIMEPTQTLGSDQWGTHEIARFKSSGLPDRQAKDQGVARFAQVQMKTQVQPVEALTPRLIQQLQMNKVQVLGLTARPLNLTLRGVQQLQSLHVNLAFTAPTLTTALISAEPSAYSQGVLIVGPHNNKGEVLMNFLKAARIKANSIVFVDDKLHNVEDVNQALSRQGLPHIEFRYGAADAKVSSFNPEIGDVQWKIFLQTGKILNDQQASQLIHRRK